MPPAISSLQSALTGFKAPASTAGRRLYREQQAQGANDSAARNYGSDTHRPLLLALATASRPDAAIKAALADAITSAQKSLPIMQH